MARASAPRTALRAGLAVAVLAAGSAVGVASGAPDRAATPRTITDPVQLHQPGWCVVPQVRGFTITRAKRKLEKAHCRFGRVVHVRSKRIHRGRVVDTRPPYRTNGPPVMQVDLRVAR